MFGVMKKNFHKKDIADWPTSHSLPVGARLQWVLLFLFFPFSSFLAQYRWWDPSSNTHMSSSDTKESQSSGRKTPGWTWGRSCPVTHGEHVRPLPTNRHIGTGPYPYLLRISPLLPMQLLGIRPPRTSNARSSAIPGECPTRGSVPGPGSGPANVAMSALELGRPEAIVRQGYAGQNCGAGGESGGRAHRAQTMTRRSSPKCQTMERFSSREKGN